jgi:S-adenosylmethionine-diacylgycerolhomoserine-N-methlytransferase
LSDADSEHRAFLNRYYGASRAIYDLTRKYYLFGRDPTLHELVVDATWSRLVEIGPGTGRNLSRLRRARPNARYGGVEASDAMLAHARRRCPWATLEQGFAETARVDGLTGGPPDRILFSYCLSMVRDPAAGLARARRSLARGGQVVVVDFGDFGGMPSALTRPFRRYLHAFRVEPLDDAILAGANSLRFGPGRYYVVARFAKAG